MEIIRIENLDFSYSGSNEKAFHDINFHIESGEIITLCGPSGSGKSTLLRHLKSVLTPIGAASGHIYYKGRLLEDVSEEIQVKEIGFVSQSADNQIVTDKVYHELAFGLESLGCDNDTICRRVGEMATFFGITGWFHKDVNTLSGGQKQIVCLASIMTMQPEVIILDEPTSQLDPIAAGEFINMLLKINRELGVTILITEHRLDEILPYSDRVLVMDEGEIIADDTPERVCMELKNKRHKMFLSMPVPVRIWNSFEDSGSPCPLTVNAGRGWLEQYVRKCADYKGDEQKHWINVKNKTSIAEEQEEVLSAENLWFKYGKTDNYILKGVKLKVYCGEIYGILGGNGAGKSTLLSLLCGIRKANRGKLECDRKISMLPQEPKNLFVKKTVRQELDEVLSEQTDKIIKLCRLEKLLERNPYDLSGGEQQRVALAKVLLTEPDILLLDEPTKGLDNEYKEVLGHLMKHLAGEGRTIIMVSHDIEFCGAWTDRCGLFFDGTIISKADTRTFFMNNSFYTTAANRMARRFIPDAIVPEDVINAFGKKEVYIYSDKDDEITNNNRIMKSATVTSEKNHQSEKGSPDRKINKRMMITAVMILMAIPFTIYIGVHFFDDRKYLFISLLVLLECIVPFFVIYEGRSPGARELVTISVLCAICIAGRLAFYMFPQFKPVIAIVILSGVTLGAEVGFLVGAVTMFVSNVVFGQGAWTPYQMFAMGMAGFMAGVFFYKKNRKKITMTEKIMLSGYGMVAAVVLYGGIMNGASLLMAHVKINKATVISYYAAGLPMDVVQGIATVLYLLLLAKPLIEKIERIKVKYGIKI